jgi:hypothetical protein
VVAGEYLQLLPALGLKVLMTKTIKPLLRGQMGIAQQTLAACHQAVLTLLLTEGIEELSLDSIAAAQSGERHILWARPRKTYVRSSSCILVSKN